MSSDVAAVKWSCSPILSKVPPLIPAIPRNLGAAVGVGLGGCVYKEEVAGLAMHLPAPGGGNPSSRGRGIYFPGS